MAEILRPRGSVPFCKELKIAHRVLKHPFSVWSIAALLNPITLGIIAGLVVGKQVGITFMAWLVTRVGLSRKIAGVTWKQIYGASMLAGMRLSDSRRWPWTIRSATST